MVRGTGLLVVVMTEEVGRGRALILRHHVVIRTANLGLLLLLAVIHEQRGIELRLAGCRWEDGEVSFAEVCSKQALLLLRKGAWGQAAEGRGGVFGFDGVRVVSLVQVEGGDGRGVTGGRLLGEGLGRRVLIAEEAGCVRGVDRIVGLRCGELLGGRIDETKTKTDGGR